MAKAGEAEFFAAVSVCGAAVLPEGQSRAQPSSSDRWGICQGPTAAQQGWGFRR